MSHRRAISALIARAGLSRSQVGIAVGLPESSAPSAMHDYLEGKRRWPEGLLSRIVEVLRPHLREAGMTDDELDAEVAEIRLGFAAELDRRLESRRGDAGPEPDTA